MVTDKDQVRPPAPLWSTRLRGLLNALTIAAGQVLLCLGLFAFALAWGYLPAIDPSTMGIGEYAGNARGSAYVVHVGLIMAAMVACAGIPSARRDPHARVGAISQGLAGVSAIVATLLGYGFISLFFFSVPGDDCARASCSPLPQQITALTIPTVLVGILMIAAAFLVNRWRWWVRALGPPVAWAALLFVQHSLWDSWLMPIFRRSS